MDALRAADPEIARLVAAESERQAGLVNLIASENLVSKGVLEAMGSILTNKYAEGIPGKRWYGGCEIVDRIESIAIDRAKRLFSAEHANVQALSGSQANQAAYFALLKPGDAILAMRLDQGGHLSHGATFNFSGQFYKAFHYGVSPQTFLLDFDAIRETALKERPKLIVAGGSAYPRHVDFGPFREIADEAGALLVADMAHFAGLVAAGIHPNPAPVADMVTSSTHKTLRGPRSGLVLSKERWAKKLDGAIFPGLQGGPHEHTIAAKAVCFAEAAAPSFKTYQTQVVANARAMAKTLQDAGFAILTGGTDTHLFLIDLRETPVTGREACDLLSEAGIVTNKNAIPYDPRPPAEASGIRIGTPTITSRGMKETEASLIASWIAQILKNPKDAAIRTKIRAGLAEFLKAFPVPA